MRRVIDFLAPLGVLIAAGAWAWQLRGKLLPGGGLGPYLVVASALIVAHLLLRWDEVVRVVGGRRLAYGANMIVLVLAFLGILAAANYLVFKNTKRWDLTKGQRYSLSDQSKKILAGLKDDVRLLYFQRKGEDLEAGRARMRDYEAASSRLKIEFVDPVADPTRARSYEVTAVPTLVLERGERREKVPSDSEQDVTNALVKLTREARKTVCFAEGHGERDLDDGKATGLTSVKTALERSQYTTKKVNLLREGRVPADCTVLVVAGPQRDWLPEAVGAARDYVKGSGKLLVMIEPEFKEAYPNLVALMAEWNLVVGKDLVLDLLAALKIQGRAGPEMLAARLDPYQEISKDLVTFSPVFASARSVEAGSATLEGTNVTRLAWVDQSAWKQTDLSDKALASIKPDSVQSQLGTVGIGAVATIKAPSPTPSPSPSASPSPATEAAPTPEGRVVAFGDVDFASNALYPVPGNSDLVLNSIAWLAQDADLISIRAREPDDQRLFLTRFQALSVYGLALLIPLLWIAGGVVSWWRRR
jgi:ABC-type uncharacterized transport system involved in gliding motility auxiliary subunit